MGIIRDVRKREHWKLPSGYVPSSSDGKTDPEVESSGYLMRNKIIT